MFNVIPRMRQKLGLNLAARHYSPQTATDYNTLRRYLEENRLYVSITHCSQLSTDN